MSRQNTSEAAANSGSWKNIFKSHKSSLPALQSQEWENHHILESCPRLPNLSLGRERPGPHSGTEATACGNSSLRWGCGRIQGIHLQKGNNELVGIISSWLLSQDRDSAWPWTGLSLCDYAYMYFLRPGGECHSFQILRLPWSKNRLIRALSFFFFQFLMLP